MKTTPAQQKSLGDTTGRNHQRDDPHRSEENRCPTRLPACEAALPPCRSELWWHRASVPGSALGHPTRVCLCETIHKALSPAGWSTRSATEHDDTDRTTDLSHPRHREATLAATTASRQPPPGSSAESQLQSPSSGHDHHHHPMSSRRSPRQGFSTKRPLYRVPSLIIHPRTFDQPRQHHWLGTLHSGRGPTRKDPASR